MTQGPRWLDEREMAAWRALVGVLNVLPRVLDRDLRAAGLSVDDYGVLVHLSEAPEGRLRLGELATALRVPKAHLTYRVQRMESAGWLERVECPSDGRGVLAVLTSAGPEALEAAAPRHVESVRRHVLDHLDADQLEALRGVMEALLADPAADCPGDCPD